MKSRTILLIEGDLDAADRVEKMLEAAGHHVIAMPDVESAAHVLEYAAPAIVLVAYPIGDRATDNVAALVRASSRPDTPVVAMFPYPSRRLATKALGDGCRDVIPKPVDRLLLEDVLRQFLSEEAPAAGGSFNTLRLVS